jgi:uridylate kinase
MEVLERQLKVMDMTAISLAMDNQLPLMVFNLKEKGTYKRWSAEKTSEPPSAGEFPDGHP